MRALEQTEDTFEAIAERAGVDVSQIRRFRTGARSISLETADRLGDALGIRVVDPDWRKLRAKAPGKARSRPKLH